MKAIYTVFLTIFLLGNVMAEEKFSDELDKQSCSQDKNFTENNSVFIPNTQYKVAGYCGFKPMRPYSCQNGRAVCYCDSRGHNCQWIWIGCG